MVPRFSIGTNLRKGETGPSATPKAAGPLRAAERTFSIRLLLSIRLYCKGRMDQPPVDTRT